MHGRDNAFVARYGVTTVDLVALVAKQRAARGLRTSLLALVSCNSVVERLPPEVPRILVAAGGEALVYGAVDYAAALALTSSAPLSSSLIAAWTPRPLEVADPAVVAARRRHALLDRAQRVLPWLLPLAAWIVVVVGAAVRRRRQRQRR